MNVKSIEKNGNQATVVVEIDKELMETGVQKAYLKARKQIAIPGFRRGKAPRKMIEAMYGSHVFYEDGLEEIFPEIYQFAIAQQDLKAIGRPSLTDMNIGEDGIVTLTLTTDVYPEVTLGQYKGVEVEKATASVTDEQVEAELNQMAKNVASTETVEDRPAQMGDTANIDFKGFVNGEAFNGGEAQGHDLVLGSGQFIPGFEDQVVGMTVGQEKEINVTFPQDYAAELAGKAAVFQVKLNKLTVTNIPEIDDELAKDVSEFDSLEELKADIRAKKLEASQKEIDRAWENHVVEAVAANATVEIPNALVETELDNQMNDFAYRLQMSGMSVEQYAKMMGGDMNSLRGMFKPMAEKQAKNNVVLNKVIEVEDIQVSEEELEEEFKSLAENYQLELEKVKEMVPTDELTASLKTRKAVKLLTDNAVATAPKAE